MKKPIAAILLITATGLWAKIPFRHVILDPRESAPAKPYGKAIGDISGDGKVDALAFSASDGAPIELWENLSAQEAWNR